MNCSKCEMPEPAFHCWANRYDCPCRKLPQVLDTRGAVQVLTWLLAEVTWKFNVHRHHCYAAPVEDVVIPHWL